MVSTEQRISALEQKIQAINAEALKTLIEQEYQEAAAFLEHAHQDIMVNFDPKVVKLRKKMKVIIADAAAKDLL